MIKKYQIELMKKSFLDNLKIFILFFIIITIVYFLEIQLKNINKSLLYQSIYGLPKYDSLGSLSILLKLFNAIFIFIVIYKFINYDIKNMKSEIMLRDNCYHFFFSKIVCSVILVLLYRLITHILFCYFNFITLNKNIISLNIFINDIIFSVEISILFCLIILDCKYKIFYTILGSIFPLLSLILNNYVLYSIGFISLAILFIFKIKNFDLKRTMENLKITFI